jgi:hypothetical protein
MKHNQWFSAKLRFVVMVEPVGGDLLNDCIYIFNSTDFSSAFQKAIDIGRLSEQEYLNVDGQRVLWVLKEVISLDIIRKGDLDGAEIYSEPIHLDGNSRIPFGKKFDPENSEPIQTI